MIVEQTIKQKLEQALAPEHLQIMNESSGHNVAPGSETHFKLIIVSAAFENLSAVKRQQRVYGILADELAGGVHALTMQTLTPAQWRQDSTVTQSPPCLGGSNNN